MIYTELTKKSMQIAYDAHKDQVDKTGLPYIFHPFHLAEQMTDEFSTCVALLHDVVEDTSVTFDDLASRGIPGEIIDILMLLTHVNSVPYMEYIKSIKNSNNHIAITVKLADLYHNSDVSRLNDIDEKTTPRLKKYKSAIALLEGNTAVDKNIVIEKESGTGMVFYVLRVDDTAFCSSMNNAIMPHPYSVPVQTTDLISKKTFTTYRNPEYEFITIVPGLKMEYQVYIGENHEMVAKMVRTIGPERLVSSCEYTIFDEFYAQKNLPYPVINISYEESVDTSFYVHLPENDIHVNIYPDKSFVYNPLTLIEERYVVCIAEQHIKWLPHIFHAYFLSLKV